MQISIHENIRQVIPNCRLGYLTISDVIVRGTPPALSQEFAQLQQEVAKVYNLEDLPKLPRVLAVRNMYKKLDFDPSRYRPASEALVRRVLQKKDLYYVNSAVDVNNYCSIKYLLPFGLYDLDQIAGNVVYRREQEGSYINIAGNMVSTDNKPFLTDDKGVFGNPTSDSRRTAVTLTTRNILAVIYADESVNTAELSGILDFAGNMFVCYNCGKVTGKYII
ncbi:MULTISPECIES: B3/4 domain-containing protein [Sporomusa]|jgi:DNA/RNA-binding domain of Phe-tRNA-synthetase-like protein|uniref:Phenylalanyl-tRNA synthetase subunit beta n=1 Tax=Sporomusa sphaeroides DSM 2875 TaxID=1337886 RepID=A0ABM9W1A3_9FIRM|nr:MULTISPECIES: phenylalanine--tRNA ligase beta subunit-related protein [Sporomusa]MCM0761023.1 phenylalanine--tRNA ligase beta subunit-related protein [Sporomusa sphaeroides DSM 2875]OLS55959.1 phenylalanine--tRNA ligase beta subunit [Sporomusa sphaeroides DSM 2875]CVK18959.1 phenylalanyl-tRNA synthetase subunit beta [Sporomusa sphaeroides DSM 2875]HML34652.1 phenylalanine--tRNA ligase beta subunit-related protein [Sporomusa sphaeroides]